MDYYSDEYCSDLYDSLSIDGASFASCSSAAAATESNMLSYSGHCSVGEVVPLSATSFVIT